VTRSTISLDERSGKYKKGNRASPVAFEVQVFVLYD